MNRATIFAVYFSNANRFIFDVQIFICIDGYPYFGGKRFLAVRHVLTMEQAIDFCENYNVSEDRRKWCVDSVDCRGKVWPVWCEEKLVCEIMENTIKTDRGINWYNFQDGDFYWDDNGFRYVVNIAGGLITVTEE